MNGSWNWTAFWGAFFPCLGVIVLGVLNFFKTREVVKKVDAVHEDVGTVKIIVNGQRTAMQEEIDGLRKLIMTSMDLSKPVPVAGMVAVDKTKAEAVAVSVAEAEKVTHRSSELPPPSLPLH